MTDDQTTARPPRGALFVIAGLISVFLNGALCVALMRSGSLGSKSAEPPFLENWPVVVLLLLGLSIAFGVLSFSSGKRRVGALIVLVGIAVPARMFLTLRVLAAIG